MRTKKEILESIDYRPSGNSHRNTEDIKGRGIEAICEILADIRDLLINKDK